VGRIQHGGPVAVGDTDPVVSAARSGAAGDSRRTPFFASHMESPGRIYRPGLAPRRLPAAPSVAFLCAHQGGASRQSRSCRARGASSCIHIATEAQKAHLPATQCRSARTNRTVRDRPLRSRQFSLSNVAKWAGSERSICLITSICGEDGSTERITVA